MHKGGHIAWAQVSASRVDDLAGRPLYGVRIVHDITERKRAEWPAAGFVDTEIECFMKPEVANATEVRT
jgi:hypothetical protein